MQLFAAAFGATNSNNNSLANIGSVKVLVVGAQGVGKSSLVSCLAGAGTGTDPGPRPSTSAPPPTRGCNVVVKLVQNAGGKAGQQFFAELWDVGADARYADLRQLFYDGVAGVMLVYDASSPKSRKAVSQWAREVAQNGSFVAPSEGMAARNIGGLPVPVLLVANKQDRLRRKLRGVDDSLAAFSEFAPLLPQGPDQLDGSTPLTLVQVSATSAVSASSNGGLDVELFNAFFRGLLDRSRGSAPSMLSSLGMRRTTGSSLPAVIAVAGGDSSCSLADRRLDEDYV